MQQKRKNKKKQQKIEKDLTENKHGFNTKI